MVAAECRSPWAVISPTPRQAARRRRLNARLENGAPEYPVNTNCDPAKSIPPGGSNPPRFKALLDVLSFEKRCAQSAFDRHILEDAPLLLDPQGTISFPTAWQSVEVSWISSSNRGLEEGVGQVKERAEP